ncbi:peptidase S24/S26A/S26B/S26C [Lipomyces oligophaga]|uniref:peptidase S24/S26A/S26B/S26C n=1 Tax=Lipomyces oligophaga TaxID=45792 RepID=UPI0034D02174
MTPRFTMDSFRRFIHQSSVAIRIVAAAHLLQTTVFQFSLTGGLSMLPTLQAMGDHVYIDKLCHSRAKNVKVGDIVVSLKPTDDSTLVCKRVAGLPGDIIYANPMPTFVPSSSSSSDKSLALDPETLRPLGSSQPPSSISVPPSSCTESRYIKVPEGHLWLLGDNASASLDSREYGPVPMGLVLGKVIFAVYWGPFDFLPHKIRWISSNQTMSDKSLQELLLSTSPRDYPK